MNVYKKCPSFEDDRFLLRFVEPGDAEDLLKVYSDKKAVMLFNSDNCDGDDFYYTTLSRMKKAIDFWLWSYQQRYFVRWTIIDKVDNSAVGTIEVFNRCAEDHFNNCGLIRLDMRSDYEDSETIHRILSMIIADLYKLFGCDMFAAKAVPQARERIEALLRMGFVKSKYLLIGSHDGKSYDDYYELIR